MQHSEASKTAVRRMAGNQLLIMRVFPLALRLVDSKVAEEDLEDNAAPNLSHLRALALTNGAGVGVERQTRWGSPAMCHRPIATMTTPVEIRALPHRNHCDTWTRLRSLARCILMFVDHHLYPVHTQNNHTMSTAHRYSNRSPRCPKDLASLEPRLRLISPTTTNIVLESLRALLYPQS